jgi:hypothetical protein
VARARLLRDYLRTHTHDPDCGLVGLSPSDQVLKHTREILSSLNTPQATLWFDYPISTATQSSAHSTTTSASSSTTTTTTTSSSSSSSSSSIADVAVVQLSQSATPENTNSRAASAQNDMDRYMDRVKKLGEVRSVSSPAMGTVKRASSTDAVTMKRAATTSVALQRGNTDVVRKPASVITK